MAIPKVAAIHDLSGLGKCSLAAAISILSVCGVQAVPLATAVLSNQTAFPSYTGVDLSEYMPMIADQWSKMGVNFEGIFTGYLSNERQVEWVGNFIDRFSKKDALVLIDPVLGDEGVYYRGFGEQMRLAMRSLCAKADVITPNLTEALLLLGEDASKAKQAFSHEKIRQFAQRLSELGPQTVIVTGLEEEQQIWNIGFDRQSGHFFEQATRRCGAGYSGTGDILSSIICGCMMRGESAPSALKRAAQLLEASIAEAVEDGTDPNEGIAFEHHLGLLMD